MDNGSELSVSRWILGAKEGNSQAFEALWRCYFERLVRLARQRLADTPRRAADEEDVALSAFASFCHAAEGGRFPDLTNRQDLWRLLITITAQKAVDQARHQRRAKRGGGRVLGESAIHQGDTSSTEETFAQIIGNMPSPSFAAMVSEQCSRLLGCLNDDLRPIAVAKMEDYTSQEIAAKLGCSVSTVERRLRLIRKIWQQEIDPSEPA